MATLWIARWSSGCRSSSSGHVALFGVVEEHFWRWLEGRPRVLRPQRVFYSTWLSRPSTRCRTSCCWSRNTGVSDHVRVYTRCASSVWTLLFGVFVAVFASLSSAVRCCLLILGCCRAFSCGSLQIVVPWLLPSALHRFFGRCCSFGLFPWLLPCAFCAPVLWQMIGCFRVSSSCRWQLLAVPWLLPSFCAGSMADIWLFPWLFPPAVLRRLWQMLAVPLACYLVPFPPGRCQIIGCFLAVGVPFVGRLWLFLGCCRALFALALFLADCWVLWLLLLAALT